MIMKTLKNKLRNNKKAVYWWRCFKYRNSKEYERFVFNDTHKLFFEAKEIDDVSEDKNIYYYIKIRDSLSGFFAIYRWILNALYVADRFNMIPCFDIIHTFYTSGEEDFFKKYFVLKSGVDSIDDKSNVFLYVAGHLAWFDDAHGLSKELLCGYDVDDKYINDLALLRNKYLDFNFDIKDEINKEINALIGKDKTVGVHYRGTDYKAGFKGHPIALMPCDYFEYIDNLLNKGYTKIFVATDDKTALDEFIDKYDDKVVYYQDTNRSSNGKSVHEFSSEDPFLKGYEVLRDMLTLASCDSLICGKSQVSIGARIERCANGLVYDFFKLIDKGNYNVDSRKKYYKK